VSGYYFCMSKKYDTKLNTIFYFISLILLLQPPCVTQIDWLYKIYIFGASISCLILLIKYSFQKQKNITINLIILFSLYITSFTLVKGGYTLSAAKLAVHLTGLSIWTYNFTSKNIQKFFKMLILVCEFYIFINFITFIIFPNGMYYQYRMQNWFLGYKNFHIRYFIPSLCLIYIYLVKYNKCKIYIFNTIFVTIVVFISVILSKSTTAFIGLLFFLIPICFSHFKKIVFMNWISLFKCYIIAIITSILMIFYNIQENFAFLIVSLFHKSISLTGRTGIWNSALYYINESPIWGLGFQEMDALAIQIGGHAHTHNYYLNLVYISGFFGLTIFTIIWYQVSVSLMNKKTDSSSNIILFALTAFLVMGLSEAIITTAPLLTVILILAENQYLQSARKNKQNHIVVLSENKGKYSTIKQNLYNL